MEALFLILFLIAVYVLKRLAFERKRKRRRDYYRNVYLKSDEWKRKRYVVLRRDNWKCVYCGARATQVYHKKYAKKTLVKNLLSGLFQFVNLVTTNNILDRIKCQSYNKYNPPTTPIFQTDFQMKTKGLLIFKDERQWFYHRLKPFLNKDRYPLLYPYFHKLIF